MSSEENINLPKDLEATSSTKEKRELLFSKAIFKESFKTNKKNLGIVAAANMILVMVIILIMSTLKINATSSAMKNLFSNSDAESEVKNGAVSYYQSYSQAASNFVLLDSSLTQMTDNLTKVLQLNKDKTLKKSIDELQIVYDAAYNVSKLNGGDENANHNAGKNAVLAIADKQIDDNTSLSSEEKVLTKYLISNYFDEKFKNSSLSYEQIINNIAPKCFSLTLKDTLKLSDEVTTNLENKITEMFKEYEKDNNKLNEVATNYTFQVLKLALANDEQISEAISGVEKAYNEDYNKYLNDANYKYESIKNTIVGLVNESLNELAYYNYLPAFEVKYVTNDLGYPITYVNTNEYDEDGNPIKKELALKSYEPDKFIVVDGELGAKANLVQKMHKDILTGSKYTEDEINQAKEDAKSDVESLNKSLNNFMNDFVKDYQNKTNYYENEVINTTKITNLVLSEVTDLASKQVVEQYNSKNNTKYTDITQITSENGQMNGTSLANQINNYAASAIASYNKIYSDKLNSGYSKNDAMLASMVVSTSSVMSMLPNDVNDSLTEMGDMNTYGIIVGMVGFAIALVLVPMAYLIMLNNSLVAQKVENGSLAFTFSTPTKRSTYIFTEEVYMIFSSTIMALALFLGALIARTIAIGLGATDFNTSLTVEMLAKFALGNYLITSTLGSICFLMSTIFNKSGQALGIGGGISIFFFICAILGLFGTKAIPGTVRIDTMNYFNYLTIFSLNDAYSVITDNVIFYYKLIGLILVSAICLTSSILIFNKKDLPL